MSDVSCFFCQNLLSDFIEGVLPAQRHHDLEKHLKQCRDCASLQANLKDTMSLLRGLPAHQVDPALTEKLWRASEAGARPWRSPVKVSMWVFGSAIPVLLMSLFFIISPQYFPWKTLLTSPDDDSKFVRVFPLMRGASEIVDEQIGWLQARDLQGGSLWEEGGISPDDFERIFQSPQVNEPVK